MRDSVILLTIAVAVSTAVTVPTPKISLINNSGGIRFEVPDIPGTSLVAVHYSVNTQLSGTQAGRWNYDIRSKTGNKWVHENHNVNVRAGDTVYYWIYAVVNRLGNLLTNQKWVANGDTGSSVPVRPVDKTPSGGSSSGQTLNGRPLKLVFEDNFNGNSVDTSKWDYDVSMWGGGNGEFQIYTPLKQNTYIKNNALFIKPTLTADKYGEQFLTTGKWDVRKEFGYCTQSSNHGCSREAKYGMLPPIMSGRLKSKAEIRYGKVEIIAKLPRGDWIWPALWMLPRGNTYGTWPRSGEIDIMEARGNRNYGNIGVEYMASTLHWGSNWDQNRYSMTSAPKKARSGTLADGYHKYTLLWDESGIDLFLDDERIKKFHTPSQGFWRWGNLPGRSLWSTKNAPFDKPFYLLVNVAVGGTNGYMPDGVPNAGYPKPWKNNEGRTFEKFWAAKNSWYPTWKGEDAAMQIDSIKMWQLQ